MDGKVLFENEVDRLEDAGQISAEMAEELLSWEQNAINGIQWSNGDVTAIHTQSDALQAVAETIAHIQFVDFDYEEEFGTDVLNKAWAEASRRYMEEE